MTYEKQILIKHLNKELNVKHFSVIKDSDFHIDTNIFNFAKNIFRENVFMSFMSASEIEISMNKYYKIPIEYYFQDMGKEELDVKLRNQVYPPKTTAMLYGNNMQDKIYQLFKVSLS